MKTFTLALLNLPLCLALTLALAAMCWLLTGAVIEQFPPAWFALTLAVAAVVMSVPGAYAKARRQVEWESWGCDRYSY